MPVLGRQGTGVVAHARALPLMFKLGLLSALERPDLSFHSSKVSWFVVSLIMLYVQFQHKFVLNEFI